MRDVTALFHDFLNRSSFWVIYLIFHLCLKWSTYAAESKIWTPIILPELQGQLQRLMDTVEALVQMPLVDHISSGIFETKKQDHNADNNIMLNDNEWQISHIDLSAQWETCPWDDRKPLTFSSKTMHTSRASTKTSWYWNNATNRQRFLENNSTQQNKKSVSCKRERRRGVCVHTHVFVYVCVCILACLHAWMDECMCAIVFVCTLLKEIDVRFLIW